jgi:stress-induced morphogen
METEKSLGGEGSESDSKVSCKSIETTLRERFKDIEYLSVEDLSDGCGDKFKIIIVTDAFEGIKLVDRHRMINGSNGALQNIMDTVHAMELKTWTKAQYAKKKSKVN